jgi:hypothetical protein
MIDLPRRLVREYAAPRLAEDLAEWRGEIAAHPRRTVLPSSVEAFVSRGVKDIVNGWAKGLPTEIASAFGAPLHQLQRSAKGKRAFKAEVRLVHSDPAWTITLRPGKEAQFRGTVDAAAIIRKARRDYPDFFRHSAALSAPIDAYATELLYAATSVYLQDVPTYSYYLPAGRSVYFMLRQLIAAAATRDARPSGRTSGPTSSDPLTSVVRNLVADLVDLRGSTAYADLADRLETRVLRGSIELPEDDIGEADVHYVTDDVELPLSRASSMVAELAPLVLYLRTIVEPSELLIVEEPEAHLHPAIQVQIAKAAAVAANRELWFVLTTHSDYFLNQIGNLTRAASLKRGASKGGRLYAEDEFIPASKVRVYIFEPGTRTRSGTVVRNLRITATGGISDAQFARIAERLYDESIVINRSSKGDK